MQKILARGAEATITKQGKTIIKNRVSKGYRHPILDEKIRKLRTRSEAKIIEKASSLIPVPKIISSDEKNKEIKIEYIEGKLLANNLEKLKNKYAICEQIGISLSKLHDAGIIHGDLTTSNLIYNEKEKKTYFIDFGLGFHSNRIEDKAVDLHLIKEALQAKHPTIYQKSFKAILKGYKSSKNSSIVLKQLEKVERRGRYKEQY